MSNCKSSHLCMLVKLSEKHRLVTCSAFLDIVVLSQGGTLPLKNVGGRYYSFDLNKICLM